MAKMGRPKKEIDKDQFEKLCSIQCTEAEICGFFDVTDKTLNRWCKENYDDRTFSEVFKEKRSLGKISLRRSQWRLAEKNAAMAIFLGKQYLGQKDSYGIEATNSENKFAEVLDIWNEKRNEEE